MLGPYLGLIGLQQGNWGIYGIRGTYPAENYHDVFASSAKHGNFLVYMYAISFMHRPISEKREIIVSMESEEYVWEKFDHRQAYMKSTFWCAEAKNLSQLYQIAYIKKLFKS